MFRARDPENPRPVAVKLFRLDVPPERVHQLVAELERLVAAELTHPAIVRPLAAGISGASAYLVEDDVAGESLEIAVRKFGAAPPAEVLRVAAQLGGALDFAAIVHVDHGAMHPRDVILSAETARLTGLGIARALERVGIAAPIRRPYTAPERLTDGGWDRRADIYSVAALVHELLWARRVGATTDDTLRAMTAIDGGDPAQLRDVFARALAEDPAARFGTALEFAGALQQAFAKLRPARAARPAPQPSAEPAPRARRVGTPSDTAPASAPQPLELPLAPPPAAEEHPAPAARRTTTSPIIDPSTTVIARSPVVGQRGSAPDDLELRRADDLAATREDSPRFVDVSVPSTPAATAAAETREPDVVRPPARNGLTSIGSLDEPPPIVPLDPPTSTSAISPLAFALVIGAAVGFAAGFGVGSRDRSSSGNQAVVQTPVAPATPATTPAPAATTGAARDGASSAVKPESDARPTTAPPAIVSPQETERAARAATAPPAPAIDPPRTRADAAEAVPSPVGLVVRSTPLGARVFVDGRAYGRTPTTVRNLARGAHRVRVTREGYQTEERQVSITSTQAAPAVNLRLSPVRVSPPAAAVRPPPTRPSGPAAGAREAATLRVDSRPPGARVFIDGRPIGTTPLVLSDVAAGEHAVRLELDGFKPWASSLRTGPGEQNRVTASLEK